MHCVHASTRALACVCIYAHTHIYTHKHPATSVGNWSADVVCTRLTVPTQACSCLAPSGACHALQISSLGAGALSLGGLPRDHALSLCVVSSCQRVGRLLCLRPKACSLQRGLLGSGSFLDLVVAPVVTHVFQATHGRELIELHGLPVRQHVPDACFADTCDVTFATSPTICSHSDRSTAHLQMSVMLMRRAQLALGPGRFGGRMWVTIMALAWFGFTKSPALHLVPRMPPTPQSRQASVALLCTHPVVLCGQDLVTSIPSCEYLAGAAGPLRMPFLGQLPSVCL